MRQRGDASWNHALRFLPLLAQQLLQYFDAFIHVLFLEQKWRQEAQDGVLGRVEEHALRQSLLYQWARGNVEHEALNESAAARFAGCGVLIDQFPELLMQIAADLLDIFKQVFLFDDCQILKSDAARQWTAAKGGAVLSGRNRGGEMLFGQERAQRHSRGDRLSDGDNVGNYAEALEGEDLSGAPEAALDFVENEGGLKIGRASCRERV